jgi:patatin-like phospholipase/acyl hydrolase
MAQQGGLRLLSLGILLSNLLLYELTATDGGGTRGLSTLYMLREIMNSIVPSRGGEVRPCEYFDLMGASGLPGLCALLFVRFVCFSAA